jgi:hypothetical protein
MDEYSKHFAGLGIDGETAMGMIVAAGGDGAIGMDKMGDALKEFTIRATDMSKSTSTAYDTLGLDTQKMTHELLKGGPAANAAMGEIVHALQSVEDPAEQSALSLALFGTPLEDLGTDQIPAFLGMVDPMGDAFDSTAGAAGKFGDTLNSGPGVALEGLKRSAETAFMALAEQALPVLTTVMDFVSKNSWVLGVLATLIGVTLVAAFVAWAISAWAVVAPLLANPVTWIVLGILALIAALIWLIANWDSVVAWVTENWGPMVAWVGEIFGGLGNWLKEIWDGFVSWFMGVMGGFGNWIVEIWQGLWNWVGEIFGGFGNWLKEIWDGFVSWFMGGLSALGSWLSGIWTGIVNFAMGIWNGFVGWLSEIPGRIMAGIAFLGQLAGIVGAWFMDMATTAWNNALALVGWVAGLPGMILGALGNLGGLLLNAGAQIMDGFLSGLRDAFGAVQDFVGGIGAWIAANKGPKAYDLGLLVPAGGWIMGGFVDSLRSHIPDLEKLTSDISTTLKVGTPDSLEVPAIASPAPPGGYGAPTGGAGVTYEIEVNNPVPEPAGQSITTTLAKTAYLGLDGGE